MRGPGVEDQTEVEQDWLTFSGQHDVGRFHVPVDNPLSMSMHQGVCHGGDNLDRLFEGQRALPDTIAQADSLQEIGDDVEVVVLQADVVDGREDVIVRAALEGRLGGAHGIRSGDGRCPALRIDC